MQLRKKHDENFLVMSQKRLDSVQKNNQNTKAIWCGKCMKTEKKTLSFSPICSTMSGGKTREAKALRKMSENSLSRPPIPIFSKFHSGLMIVCRASLVFAFPVKIHTGTTWPANHGHIF